VSAKVGENLTSITKQSLCQRFKYFEINGLNITAREAAQQKLTIYVGR
jgi:hypothetical protein